MIVYWHLVYLCGECHCISIWEIVNFGECYLVYLCGECHWYITTCSWLCLAVFLALKKIEVKQNKDSDSKPDVGVSTLARHAAAFGECYLKRSQLLGGGGMSPANFFFREGFRCLLQISTLSYQWVSQSPTEILCGTYTYPTPGVSVVCYVTVCQPAASSS